MLLDKSTIFIEKAKKVHGEKYDYSKVVYSNSKTKVEIICPIHGSFWQSPDNHLQKNGCPACGKIISANSRRFTTKKFIEMALEVHGDIYDYKNSSYINNDTKVEIICPIHGSFWQSPYNHINRRHGCPVCGKEKIINNNKKNTKTTKNFIKEARIVHGNIYDYSKVNYINAKTKVEIICPIHGSFVQTPGSHLNKNGCPVCGKEKVANINKRNTKTVETFIYDANIVHGNIYDYSKVNYINSTTKVEIICPKHGTFLQRPNDHLQGQGCPSCAGSRSQNEVADFIKSIGFSTETNNRTIISPLEIDIYITEKNVAIEYHGLYWHSEQMLKKRNVNNVRKYHLEKFYACKKENIRLIQIFEDEWIYKKDIVKNRLKHILGIYEKKIGARNTTIQYIDAKTKNTFLETYHIQGKDASGYKYGAYYKNELIGVMTFAKPRVALGRKKTNNNEFELSRFATKAGILCFGLASKMFTHFIRTVSPDSIYSFSDKRWNTGNVYSNIGMKLISSTNPNYWYIVNSKRIHRFSYRKQLLENKLDVYDKNITEYENMLQNGIDRIWDCGSDKFIWTK